MKRILPFLLLLNLPAPAHAMEVYQAKTPEVYRAKEIEVHRAAEVPAYKSREVEMYTGKPVAPEGTAPSTAAEPKRKSFVKGVEGAAAIAARREFCSLPDRGMRGKILTFLSASGRSRAEVASYASIFDSTKTAALQKTRLSEKGRESLCSPEVIRKLDGATDKILAALSKGEHRASTTAEARKAESAVKTAPAGGVKLFTKEDLEQMHKNDVKAGRTSESMTVQTAKKAETKKTKTSQEKSEPARTYNPDPYNTGGWNYNTNQSASPIWSPFNQ